MATITEDLPSGEDAVPYNPAMYELLKTIDDPARLRALERRQLGQLADELRADAHAALAVLESRGARLASLADFVVLRKF